MNHPVVIIQLFLFTLTPWKNFNFSEEIQQKLLEKKDVTLSVLFYQMKIAPKEKY
jgi:putative effector of murein hydrolase